MLAIKNHTPMPEVLFPYTNPQNENVAVVVVKGTFDIDTAKRSLKIANEQLPILQADEYWSEPNKSSLRSESDCSPLKSATDFFISGDLITPDEVPRLSMDASVGVGAEQRHLLGLGQRYWIKRTMHYEQSEAMPFTRIPLRFENAFGGCLATEAEAELERFYAQNPVGKGYAPKGYNADGVELPQLENPAQLIQNPDDRVMPHCPGYVARNWQPRAALAGSYDELWQKENLPNLPGDFDHRFYNAASPTFTFPRLQGTEAIVLNGFSPQGVQAFNLPNWGLAVRYCLKDKISALRSTLDTIHVLTNENQVQLTWRLNIPCGQDFLYIKWLEIKPYQI